MGLTLAQKILANHTSDPIDVGNFVNVRVDLTMGHDVSGPHSARILKKDMGVERVWDPEKVVLVTDHFLPARDIQAAALGKALRDFADEQNIPYYFEVGRSGICHVVLPEEGFVVPGDVIIGGDSHSCTYGALGAFGTGVGATDLAAVWATGEIWLRVPSTIKIRFTGKFQNWVYPKDVVLHLMKLLANDRANYKSLEFYDEVKGKIPVEGRMTISNMTIEAGGKVGMFLPDEVTFQYLKGRARKPYTPVYPDPDAEYEEEIVVNVSALEPQVALPFSPSNTVPISEVEGKKVPIDQVIIGSCTNARLSDLRIVGAILKALKGQKIHPKVRAILLPGSQRVYREALSEGLIEVFMDAGIAVSLSTCGPCFGGHVGVLGKGERAVSTTNRNFHGRMGHPDAEVYLASPAVAITSAILGYVASPIALGIPPVPVEVKKTATPHRSRRPRKQEVKT